MKRRTQTLVLALALFFGAAYVVDAQTGGGATAALQRALNGYVDQLEGYVDGLETLLGTSNTNTGNIATSVGTIDNAISGNEMQVDVVTSALPSGAATAANQSTLLSQTDGLEGQIGATNESAAASDTATSGLNGLLKRIAQNLTTVAGRFMGAAALADNTANPTTTGVAAFMMCFDGSTWDRCSGSAADTELPAAAALADNTANPTVPGVAAYFMCYDGSTWDRCRTSTDATFGTTTYSETSTTGPAIGFVRKDSPTTTANTENEIAPPTMDSLSRTWVRIGNPCADHARVTHAAISESTAATNEIVALNGSDLIVVCSYKVVVAGASTLKWVRGTGTDCGTGTTDIEGAQSYAANSGITEHGGGAPVFVVPAGNALCLTAGSAVGQAGRISYVRTAAP